MVYTYINSLGCGCGCLIDLHTYTQVVYAFQYPHHFHCGITIWLDCDSMDQTSSSSPWTHLGLLLCWFVLTKLTQLIFSLSLSFHSLSIFNFPQEIWATFCLLLFQPFVKKREAPLGTPTTAPLMEWLMFLFQWRYFHSSYHSFNLWSTPLLSSPPN